MIINCKEIAKKINSETIKQIAQLKTQNITPKIVIIDVSNTLESKKYITHKAHLAEQLGIECEIVNHLKNENALIAFLKKINDNCKIHGYLLQLPLPKNFSYENILEYFDPNKDIDAISNYWVAQNVINKEEPLIYSCTTSAILKIFKERKYNLSGKNVVIVNRSQIIGKPLISALLRFNATVTVCHSHTKNLSFHTNNADILISAIGRPNFFKKRSVKKNAFIIDGGITYLNNKVIGDFDKQVITQARHITLVPNGIGVITISYVFHNLIKLINLQQKKISSEN